MARKLKSAVGKHSVFFRDQIFESKLKFCRSVCKAKKGACQQLYFAWLCSFESIKKQHRVTFGVLDFKHIGCPKIYTYDLQNSNTTSVGGNEGWEVIKPLWMQMQSGVYTSEDYFWYTLVRNAEALRFRDIK